MNKQFIMLIKKLYIVLSVIYITEFIYERIFFIHEKIV